MADGSHQVFEAWHDQLRIEIPGMWYHLKLQRLSNNLTLALVDLKGRRLLHKKLPCQLECLEQALDVCKKRIHTIA